MKPLVAAAAVLVALTAGAPVQAQPGVPGEWRHYGADGANTKYSPLDQITVTNFSDLEVAWRWISISTEVASRREQIRPGLFKATPLMVGGLVYVSTPLGQVAALDAGTGEAVWTYDPHSYDRIEQPANIGWQHRGLSLIHI